MPQFGSAQYSVEAQRLFPQSGPSCSVRPPHEKTKRPITMNALPATRATSCAIA